MVLSFQPLESVTDVNHFTPVPAWRLTAGDTPTLYFQLVDASRGGCRYVPASVSYLQVALHNIDDAKKLFKTATQPWPLQDPSIWAITLAPGDACVGTPDILLTLTEFAAPGLVAVTGNISMTNAALDITLTLDATTFAQANVGDTLVIGVNSCLYAHAPVNGGVYTVTAAEGPGSTVVTAKKVVDLFYGGTTYPSGDGVPVALTSLTDVVIGAPSRTTSGLVQSRLWAQTTGRYAVPYRGGYQDVLTGQPGWDGF
jgi:hypothetical protein